MKYESTWKDVSSVNHSFFSEMYGSSTGGYYNYLNEKGKPFMNENR